MNAFECYTTYLALKLHFSPGKYNFFLYNGKVGAKVDSFEKRRDKYYFHKMARHPDPQGLILSNILAKGVKNLGFIASLVDPHDGLKCYAEWRGRIESLSYNFTQDLQKFNNEDFTEDFRVIDGERPRALVMYSRGEIRLETLVIIDKILHVLKYWDENVKDTIMYPEQSLLINRYSPFVNIDVKKYSPLIKELLTN
jgi:hypothetical protein